MGSKLFEPLSSQVSIVDEAGKPTAYFTRVLQKISLGPGITATNGILSAATAWGDITGTLSAQTDLQAALNAKANLAGGNSFTGDQTVVGTVTADAVTSYGTMNVGWPDAVHNGSLTLYNTGSATLNLRNVSAPGVYTTMQLFWNGTIGELFVPVGSSFVFRVDTLTFRTGANVSYGSMDSTGLHLTGSATITAANIPVSPGGTTSFLRADGTWAAPSGGGGGTAWDFIPPLVADFTNFYSFDANNLVFNTNDTDVGLSLTNPSATTGTNKGRIATKALPTGGVDWTLTVKLGLNNGGASIAGIAIYESTTGKAIMFGADMGATSMSRAVYSYTGTLGTFGTIRLQQAQRASSVGFYRVARVGSNIVFSVSPDGKHFVTVLSQTLVTDFTTAPDHIGFGVVNPAAATVPTIINCPYWVQSW